MQKAKKRSKGKECSAEQMRRAYWQKILDLTEDYTKLRVGDIPDLCLMIHNFDRLDMQKMLDIPVRD